MPISPKSLVICDLTRPQKIQGSDCNIQGTFVKCDACSASNKMHNIDSIIH